MRTSSNCKICEVCFPSNLKSKVNKHFSAVCRVEAFGNGQGVIWSELITFDISWTNLELENKMAAIVLRKLSFKRTFSPRQTNNVNQKAAAAAKVFKIFTTFITKVPLVCFQRPTLEAAAILCQRRRKRLCRSVAGDTRNIAGETLGIFQNHEKKLVFTRWPRFLRLKGLAARLGSALVTSSSLRAKKWPPF